MINYIHFDPHNMDYMGYYKPQDTYNEPNQIYFDANKDDKEKFGHIYAYQQANIVS